MLTDDEIREQFDPPRKRPATGDVRLIGLCGYARSGKDSVAEILSADYGFTRVAFADALKDVAYLADPHFLRPLVDAYGWDAAKKEPKVREFLQDLGVAVRLILGPDTWIDAALPDTKPPFGSPVQPLTVVSDVRFPNEAAAIRERGGVVWQVVRPGVGPVNAHESESALFTSDFTPDRIIRNSGTLEDLRREVLKTGKGPAQGVLFDA